MTINFNERTVKETINLCLEINTFLCTKVIMKFFYYKESKYIRKDKEARYLDNLKSHPQIKEL